jgi:type IV secretion system protein VirD4
MKAAAFALWPMGLTAAWVLVASALWAFGTHTPFSPIGWWTATQWWLANWWVNLWLVLSAAVATLLLAMLLFGLFQYRRLRVRARVRLLGPSPRHSAPRPSERGITDNHGHSNWRSAADTEKLFPGPHPKWGGIAVGEAYRVDQDSSVAGIPFEPEDSTTWGRGGKAPLLIAPCVRGSCHSLIFAGSGAYKTSSAASTVLTWTGSSVILDPSTELGPMLDGALRQRGTRTFHIGTPTTDDDDRPPRTGFNVLSWMDINHPEAEQHVESVVSWIYDDAADYNNRLRAADPFFEKMGRALVKCILAHVLWSAPPEIRTTLKTFVAYFAVGEKKMLSLLSSIQSDSKSPLARQLAGTLMDPAALQTFSGIFLNASNGVQWLFTRTYAMMVSEGDFDPRLLLTERTTVFVNVNLRTLETAPALPRVLIGALLNTLYMADGKTDSKVLFLLDEAKQLGKMKTIETARDDARKYKIVLHCLWQSIGQMTEIWGREGTRAWIDACSWIGYASIRAGGAGKNLSEELGSHGVLAWSEGDNQGSQRPFGFSFGTTSRGNTMNAHEIRRSLITASELQQDLREDELIVEPASGLPIRCGRALWFRRSKMKALIATSRFVNPSSSTKPKVNA